VQLYKGKILNKEKVRLICRQYVQGSRAFRCFPQFLAGNF